MIRTRVGYTGGTTENPTYKKIGDHSEAIQIDFDPTRITYRQLLEIFFASHDPCRGSWSTQYKNALFVHDDAQRKVAEEVLAGIAKKTTRELVTPVVKAGRFYRAEDYHQKYWLSHEKKLLAELRVRYPRFQDLVDSTAAARLNGFLSRHGSPEALERGWAQLGISETAAKDLLARIRKR